MHAIASPSRNWTQTKIASYLTYCNKDIHVGRVSIACIDRSPLNNVIWERCQSGDVPLSFWPYCKSGEYVKVSLIGRIIIRGTLVYICMYRAYGDMLLE